MQAVMGFQTKRKIREAKKMQVSLSEIFPENQGFV
jgi:hypothetical protein